MLDLMKISSVSKRWRDLLKKIDIDKVDLRPFNT
ncbi:F-box protein, partial [Klebsiella pneumoniae]